MRVLLLIIFTIVTGLFAIYFPLIFYPKHFKFQRFTKDTTFNDRARSTTVFRAGLICMFVMCTTSTVNYLFASDKWISNLLTVDFIYCRILEQLVLSFLIYPIMINLGKKSDTNYDIPELPSAVKQNNTSV